MFRQILSKLCYPDGDDFDVVPEVHAIQAIARLEMFEFGDIFCSDSSLHLATRDEFEPHRDIRLTVISISS